MAKRSPFESYRKRQQAANSKHLDIWLSQRHPCLCSHPQGFHWPDDDGENTGTCGDTDSPCEAFDENVLAAAQLAAGVLPETAAAAKPDEAGDDDALARAMRAEEGQREWSAEETWDRALNAKRRNPIGKPDTLHNPAAVDALRELGSSPEDLTG